MKLRQTLLLSVVLVLSTSYSKEPFPIFAQESDSDLKYWDQAREYSRQGKYLEAAQMYEKSAEVEPYLHTMAGSFELAGDLYFRVGHYEKALDCFSRSLSIYHEKKLNSDLAVVLSKTGRVYEVLGQYEEALEHYMEALSVYREVEDTSGIAGSLIDIGWIHRAWGQYEEALWYVTEALSVYKRTGTGRLEEVATALREKGRIHRALGQDKDALQHYEKALLIYREMGDGLGYSEILIDIAEIYKGMGEYVQAKAYFENALDICQKLSNTTLYARCLTHIGALYTTWKQYSKALETYTEALSTFQKFQDNSSVAAILQNIASVYYAWGYPDEATQYYIKALQRYHQMKSLPEVAKVLDKIGEIHVELGSYLEAINDLQTAVEIKEKLRKTATGNARREYLASQMNTYENLTWAQFQNNDLYSAYKTIELSRAKYLAERLSNTDEIVNLPSVPEIQQELPDRCAILVYTNINSDKKMLLVLTKNRIVGTEISTDSVRSIGVKGQVRVIGPVALTEQEDNSTEPREKQTTYYQRENDAFNSLIIDYRNLLALSNRGNQERIQQLGRLLYDTLIKPVADHIDNTNRLLIMPDGILNFLPFEALVDQKGRYLVETHHITYTQSIRVLELLKNRKYNNERKTMLSVGGAIYNETRHESIDSMYKIENEVQLAYLQKRVDKAIAEGRSLRNVYSKLGLQAWRDLPGTLREVNTIKKIMNGSEVITGAEASENNIKQLSVEGTLAEYKVLHFATHALAVPFMPELSALVLSQFSEERNGEDGYLHAGEIAELRLRADFVNLSCCETGLGKLYEGEGVVGLTHAFLLAGANGVSVSLWEVEDNSTAEFMLATYQTAKDLKMDYAQALTTVKRRFIRGDFGEKYKIPFFWAPFIYYGNSSLDGSTTQGVIKSTNPANALFVMFVVFLLVLFSVLLKFKWLRNSA
jgi:CHAT domain-containing protein